MDTEEFERARLLPTAGIGGGNEAEMRATSALLAVLSIVRPFSLALLEPFRSSNGKTAVVDAFIETVFKAEGEEPELRPDGLLAVTYGNRDPWWGVIEVKTGDSKLDKQQVDNYVKLARRKGFDCVITISNEIEESEGVHPCSTVPSNSTVKLWHLSWTHILTTALSLRFQEEIDDPEQAWILDELIRYLQHKKSGVSEFDSTAGVSEAAKRWDQLLGFTTLKLLSITGRAVEERMSREQRKGPSKRTAEFKESLAADGSFTGVLRAESGVDVTARADIRTSQAVFTFAIPASDNGGPVAAVNTLVRSLADAPGNVTVEAIARNKSSGEKASLAQVRSDSRTLLNKDAGDPNRFVVTQVFPIGTSKSGKKGLPATFVSAATQFWEETLSTLAAKPPPKPPKNGGQPEVEEEQPALQAFLITTSEGCYARLKTSDGREAQTEMFPSKEGCMAYLTGSDYFPFPIHADQ